MSGVDQKVIEQSLNVIPRSVLIKQKKRGQASDRNKASNAELATYVNAGIL